MATQANPRTPTVHLARLAALGLNQARIARILGMHESSASRKVNGSRPWHKREIDAILAAARQVEPSVGYDDLFSPASPEALAS